MLARLFGKSRSPESLVDSMLRVINRRAGRAVNRDTLSSMQKDIIEIFDKSLNTRGERWLLFEGLEVTGATIQLLNGVISFKWETIFVPKQRHTNQFGRAQPLGFFEEYDLWVVKYGNIPPVLIARHGSSVQDYKSTVPGIELIEGIGEISPALKEAHRRAIGVGIYGVDIPIDPTVVLPE